MAVIGCPEAYTVLLVRQPGTYTGPFSTGEGPPTPVVAGELTDLISVQWGRMWSRTSGSVVEAKLCADNRRFFQRAFETAYVEPWAWEIWIFRDGLLAWAGPIVSTVLTRETVRISGLDSTSRLAKKTVPVTLLGVSGGLGSIAMGLARLVYDESTLIPASYNVPWFINNMHVVTSTGIISINLSYDKFNVTAADIWRDLEQQGFNWTTFGWYTLLYSSFTAANNTVPYGIESADIGAELELVTDGSNFALEVPFQDANGFVGRTSVNPALKTEYGALETPLLRVNTSGADANNLVLDVNRQVIDLTPQLVIPDGSSLSPDALIMNTGFEFSPAQQVALPDLVPGLRYDVSTTSDTLLADDVFPQRLSELRVSWDAENGESVQVSFTSLAVT